MSGFEVVGLVATIGGLRAKSVHLIDNLRTTRKLSKENEPLCSALNTQLVSLRSYVEEMERMHPVELGRMGPQWAGALGQLASDMAGIVPKLGGLMSVKSRSRTKAKVVMLKNASDVSAVLQHTETKLGIAWSRLQGLDTRQHMARHADEFRARFDQLEHGLAGLLVDRSRSLAVFERMTDLNVEALSMAKAAAIIEEEGGSRVEAGDAIARLEASGLHPNSDLSTGSTSTSSAAGETIGSAGTGRALPSSEDYENEREKLEELQPRLGKFLRRLEGGKVRARMSAEERRDLAAILERLLMPWKLNWAALTYGLPMVGDGGYGIVFEGKLGVLGGKIKVGEYTGAGKRGPASRAG